ncbi:right-handed parallel beta-helix repeat-containing protein [bacterium]|nr:right-handed parallel beta-helix repeat-containing protein [bacterium]
MSRRLNRIWPGFVITVHLAGRILIVDNQNPAANDLNPGTGEQPFLTVQAGVDAALPGDSVLVSGGVYGEIIFSGSGQADSWITVQGAADEASSVCGITFSRDAAYIRISRFNVQDFNIWGVFFQGANHHIELSRLRVTGGECGIHLTWGEQAQDPEEGPVSDIWIDDSIVENCLYTAIDCTPGPCHRVVFSRLTVTGAGLVSGGSWGSDGIAVERGSDITVKNCIVHDNGGDGIDLNSRDFDGNCEGIAVEANQVFRNHRNGIKLWGGGTMINNVLWGQGDTPVVIGDYPGEYHIVNNTIVYNMWDNAFSVRNYAFVAAYPDDATGLSASVRLTLFNNIFAFNSSDGSGGPTGLYLGPGVQLVHEGSNCYYSREDGEIQADFMGNDVWFSRQQIRDGTWTAATGQGQGDITQDPLLLNGWPDVDPEISGSSPLIDRGESLNAPETDCLGRKRPAGAGVDIGALEHTGGTGTGQSHERISPHTPFFHVWPNPFNTQVRIRYTLDKDVFVRIFVSDLGGRRLATLREGIQTAGDHVLGWNGAGLTQKSSSSGIYFLIMEADGQNQSCKLLMLK